MKPIDYFSLLVNLFKHSLNTVQPPPPPHKGDGGLTFSKLIEIERSENVW